MKSTLQHDLFKHGFTVWEFKGVVNIKSVFNSMKTYTFGKDPKHLIGEAVAEWLVCG